MLNIKEEIGPVYRSFFGNREILSYQELVSQIEM